jgi:hypothetical protein
LAETPVELPDDLVRQARANGISIAEVDERALRQAGAAAKGMENAVADVRRRRRRQQASASARLDPPGFRQSSRPNAADRRWPGCMASAAMA